MTGVFNSITTPIHYHAWRTTWCHKYIYNCTGSFGLTNWSATILQGRMLSVFYICTADSYNLKS